MSSGRRKKCLINRGYQTRFIAAFMLVCLALIALAFTGVLYEVDSTLEGSMYKGHIASTGIQYIVLPAAAKISMVFMLAGAVAIGAVSYYFAQRTQWMVSGFGQGLKYLREGRLDFCFNDDSRHDFPELDAAFNAMLSKSRGRLERMKGISTELEGLLNSLKSAQASGADERADVLRQLNLRVNELSGALEDFRLDRPA